MDVTAAAALREATRADLVATSLREATALCLDLARVETTGVSKAPITLGAA